MSLKIIKAGVFDTIQDLGRYGFQHLGINPGGAMDRFAAQAVNTLLGNNIHESVIELHFPSSIFLFEKEAMIAIGGGDFTATINGEDIPLWQPIVIAKNSLLQFQKWKQGARCYLALREKLKIDKWLNSYSTNVKAAAGGFNGRALQKDDLIQYKEKNDYAVLLHDNDFLTLPWKADVLWTDAPINRIAVTQGHEWDWLGEEAKSKFLTAPFTIGSLADRMGYRLQSTLQAIRRDDLVSSVVSFGTIQLLPNGELIILMADHQTTGGYPRIGHVVSAHLPILAQKQPGDKIYFRLTEQQNAEELLLAQNQHLRQLQDACKLRLDKFFRTANAQN
ncbi:MAG TPA: biotin-dependent carboxyltransferase family protein [Chitinophagaceae bacterium]|nr:biotin-dependent carboxyltransferase family protein [Chitinophagaceae bacterium]